MGRGLSGSQIKALRAACSHDFVLMSGPRSHPETSIAYALFGKRDHLTGAERASMSRTLRRLAARGLIMVRYRVVRPTDDGAELIRRQDNG